MKENKKVLIIVRNFIPYFSSLGGVIRVLKLSTYLQENGYEVFLLAAKGEFISYFGYETSVNNLNIKYVDDFLQRSHTRLSKNIGSANVDGGNNTKTMEYSMRVLRKAKNVINELIIPDLGVLATPKFYRAAKKMISENNIYNVIVSSPPHSTQLVGYFLKKHYGEHINFIVDYRDSWNLIGIFQKKYKLANLISRYLEKKILTTCDHFSFVSPLVLEKINTQLFGKDVLSQKSVLIMNGYDLGMVNLMKQQVTINNKQLVIGYYGAISDRKDSFRDPTNVFEAIQELGDMNIKLKMYGHIDICERWRELLKDKLEIMGNLSHSDALKSMKYTDVLMLLHSGKNGAEEVIPGKIYEYMLSERPIWCVGPEIMQAKTMVVTEKLGYISNVDDKNNIKNVLSTIYNAWLKNRVISYHIENLYHYSRQHQYSKYFDMLE